ncbi:Unknown protein sequence [Pseudomonas syringae pv. syringae]|uniref:Uncharacterized protein n=1 Tax=Pseudomonas syringae pv. solidagae TaxID=264458 RepID=A0A0P9Z234_PSESX|nr:Unknown protein sequence [Pseudomonas syringae pv. syringae]KPY53201.1 hypothetical protein ALO46_102120 [Pseudomonas syringae pv. solidagae]RMR60588.1 hypothetical protein ALP85_101911 [Pseudomonas syringae pv. syringae]RMT32612.1 hypothetical protein ALP49_102139 [Pseudomonas syringae pv. solidagae]RMT40140.1 hypothetical protein ALP48_102088 [Pseudomonas syringae pv. solidagae]
MQDAQCNARMRLMAPEGLVFASSECLLGIFCAINIKT